MTVEKIRGDNGNSNKFPVGMRVLAVDDDPICLKLLDTLLWKCQYHVTTTSQARIALQMLRENRDRFDLVISDVHMPDMDGFKLLELVGLEMDLPVIMLSANSDPKYVMKGVTHGACDYLVKPVRIEELRNIWQHVIRRKKPDSMNWKTSTDQAKANQASVEGQGSPMAVNADENRKFNRKRKDEDDVSEDNNGNESEDPATQKKPRVVWSIELHRKFVAAVNQLGIEKAVPKRILDMMNVEGLTRENVASHLQKYRLYLRRISSVATQQANMATALGVKDSHFMRLAPFDNLGDFRTLAGPGRLPNAALSPYTAGGMLGRLNTPANINLHNLIQPSHSQTTYANQNPSLFQGIPSPLELDQLQQTIRAGGVVNFSALDESRMNIASNNLTESAVNSSLTNMYNGTPSNLHGNYQTLSGGGLGNQSSHKMLPFNSETQQNVLLSPEPVHGQLPVNSAGRDNFVSGPYIHSAAMHLPLEDSRGFIGDVQSSGQRWGEQGQSYGNGLNSNSEIFDGKIVVNDRLGGGASTLTEQNENEKFAAESRARANDNFLLEQTSLQGGFVHRGYDPLDDMMSAMVKQEQDDSIPSCDFGFDDYSFGPGI